MTRVMSCSTIRTVMPRPRMPADELAEGLRLRGIQAAGRLVEEQQARPGRQGAGDLHHPLPAEGQRHRLPPRRGRRRPARPARPRHSLRACASSRAVAARPDHAREKPAARAHVRAHHDVLQHAHAREEARSLERPRDAPRRDPVGRQTGDRRSVEGDGPCGRRDAAGDQVEEGRLSRAVGADDRLHDPRRTRESHVVDDVQAAEPLLQAADGKERGARSGAGRGAHRRTLSRPPRPLGAKSMIATRMPPNTASS